MVDDVNCESLSDNIIAARSVTQPRYFACLVNRYEQKLLRYVRRISGVNVHDAEDLVQEIFIKVYKNLNDFDGGLSFSAWIYRIAHNHVISAFRKKQARPQAFGGEEMEALANTIASDTDLNKDVDAKLRRQNIERVLKHLDERYREVLVLRYLEEKSYSEIADILQKPEGTVATLLNRAKSAFAGVAVDNSIHF